MVCVTASGCAEHPQVTEETGTDPGSVVLFIATLDVH